MTSPVRKLFHLEIFHTCQSKLDLESRSAERISKQCETSPGPGYWMHLLDVSIIISKLQKLLILKTDFDLFAGHSPL